MTNEVTLNGNTYNDGATPPRNMANGGHRDNLIPMLSDAVVDLAAKAALATTNGAAQVALAADQVTLAEAAAAAAEAASSASIWISGTTYAIGDVRFSPIDFLSYRRKTDGGGTTDPSIDTTNWVLLVSVAPSWSTITANPAPAVAGTSYMCNTTSAAFTVTLPAAPAANAFINLADYAGTFAINNLTVGRNGLKIMGLSEDMVISTNNVSITLTYIDASRGWILT